MSGLGLPRSRRLLSPAEYSAVFDNARFRSSHGRLLILGTYAAAPKQYARLGLVISKKNVRLATDRNRLKRIMREHFRLRQHDLVGINLVIVVRGDLTRLGNKDVTGTLEILFEKIRKQLCQPL